MFLTMLGPAIVAAAAAAAPPVLPASDALAARALASGRTDSALATLERASLADPDDAALLINLAIAYAQAGEDIMARAAFIRALACNAVVELETADGSVTDSRRLARKALRMLERGEFRIDAGNGNQFTRPD